TPLPGLKPALWRPDPTADAVGYYLAPLPGLKTSPPLAGPPIAFVSAPLYISSKGARPSPSPRAAPVGFDACVRRTPPHRPPLGAALALEVTPLALPLFAITLFVSAFLLFLVQPMIGKMVLPQLGGTPQVWNTCVLFFQTCLLAGYAYSHTVSSRLRLRSQ